MNTFELVIAGGGLSAARVIKSYREAGAGGLSVDAGNRVVTTGGGPR